MAEVAILVPTFRRPKSLARLLASLATLETDATVEVIVADNDAEGREGIAVCQALQERYRWPLSALVIAERGIAQARNGLVGYVLAHSDAVHIAMLDDDESAHPHWLSALLKAQAETDADAVRGEVLRITENEPLSSRRLVAGAARLVEEIDGAGNVLIERRVFEGLTAPHFDPAFALTGGEDREFFTRLRRKGCRFAFAPDAMCYEHVPASRDTLKWKLMRAYRIGNSDMRVFVKYCPSPLSMLAEITKIGGALAVCSAQVLLAGPDSKRRIWALCKLSRAFGKIAALFGRYYHEYVVVHGA